MLANVLVSSLDVVLAHVIVLAHVMLLDCVMGLASVMVFTYIWIDDYLHVVICGIFSNKTYHHIGTLQC